jgi:hypothetical protein
MDLKKALELKTEFYGSNGVVRVDKDEYICINDLQSFFPEKRIDVWLRSDKTKEFIDIVEKNIIPLKGGIITKRGKGGGTYAHHLIAFDFAMWLSPEFKLKVYTEYINGTQHKKDWNIKRIHAAFNYKIMTESIKNDHDKPMHFHFSNEALMINEIVFGVREGNIRDTASEEKLDQIACLEGANSTLIDIGLEYAERKEKLKEIFTKKFINQIKEVK